MAEVRKKSKKRVSKTYESFDVYLKDMEPATESKEYPSEYYLLGSRAVDIAVVEYQEHRGLTSRCR